MNQEIKNLIPVEWKGKRVITTKTLAKCYGIGTHVIRENFKNNKSRFIEGKHYYKLEYGDRQDFKNQVDNSDIVGKNAVSVTVWTELGVAEHTTIINTYKAMDIHKQLRATYFTVQEEQPKQMNTELIKIVTNEQGQNCVSARELHEGLGNKRQFTDWIKQRITKYGFEENNDYIVINLISQNCEIKNNHGGNRKSVDYIITVDMAKELCMVENNDLGRKFRKYFIECEKKLQEVQQPKQMSDMEILARAILISDKQIKELQAELSEKTEFIDEINDCYTFADIKRRNRLLLSRRKDIILSTHTLIETAQSLGIPVNKVQNPNPCSAYTVINAYPRKVWETAYPELVLPEKEEI